jgi:hypothetical protein
MSTIDVTPEVFFSYRRSANLPFFISSQYEEFVELYLQASESIQMRCRERVTHPEVARALPYANAPVAFTNVRDASHDFGNSSSWGSGGSTYILAPSQSCILYLEKLSARFPENVMLSSENPLVFSVKRAITGSEVVEVLRFEYESVNDLLLRTNEPVGRLPPVPPDLHGRLFVDFRLSSIFSGGGGLAICAPYDTIEIGPKANTAFLGVGGVVLESPSWVLCEGKETPFY